MKIISSVSCRTSHRRIFCRVFLIALASPSYSNLIFCHSSIELPLPSLRVGRGVRWWEGVWGSISYLEIIDRVIDKKLPHLIYYWWVLEWPSLWVDTYLRGYRHQSSHLACILEFQLRYSHRVIASGIEWDFLLHRWYHWRYMFPFWSQSDSGSSRDHHQPWEGRFLHGGSHSRASGLSLLVRASVSDRYFDSGMMVYRMQEEWGEWGGVWGIAYNIEENKNSPLIVRSFRIPA